MKKPFLFLIAIFVASASVSFGQDDPELTPRTDPDFERSEMVIRPIWDYEGEIVIDGQADEGFWNQIEPMVLQWDVSDAWWSEASTEIDPEIAASGDYHVTWKVTMDEEFFYIFAEIVDDVLRSRSMHTDQDEWLNDNLELFFLFADTNVYMPDWALSDASQIRIFADLDEQTADTLTAAGWAGGMITDPYQPMGYQSRTVETDNGYNIEARIPLGLIVPTNEQGEFGYYDDEDNFVPIVIREIEVFQFDIQAADRDDPDPEAGRKYLHQWSANWNRNWGFTEGYGRVTVGEPLTDDPGDPDDPDVPEEATPRTDPRFERKEMTLNPIWDYEGEIVIDGQADEGFWDLIEPMELKWDVSDAWFTNDTEEIDPEIAASGDYHVTWKVTMDEEFFYIFAEIVDDVLRSRSMHTDQDEWLNDNLELFFLFADTNVYMPDWALSDASQIRIYADLDEQTADTLTAAGWAGGMITDPYQPMGYQSRTVETDNGYNIEARIPLGLIVPTNEEGEFGYYDDDDNFVPIVIREIEVFQFDIQAADRDDPDPEAGRKYLHQWSATWNRNWGFTEGYGRVTVGEPLATSILEPVSESELSIYPNPASDYLVIENLEGRNQISIVNMLGQEVYRASVNNATTVLDITSLGNGIYLLQVTNDKGLRVARKFIKR